MDMKFILAGLGGNVSQGAARGWVSEAWRGRWWVGGYVEHIVIVFILSLLLTPAAARQLLETPRSAHCRSSKAYLH